jgi:hypothetical protein
LAAFAIALAPSSCASAPDAPFSGLDAYLPPAVVSDAPNEVSGVAVVANRVAKRAESYEYSIEFPTFPGHEALNAEVADRIESLFGEFIAEAEKNRAELASVGAHDAPWPPFTLDIRWNAARLDGRYVSVAFESYRFTGGAHGMSRYESINYDLSEGRTLSIGDLLGSDPDWLVRLSDEAIAQLSERFPDGFEEWFAKGAAPDPANFACFTFTRYTITVQFQLYQVAPYAYGAPSITIRIPEAFR